MNEQPIFKEKIRYLGLYLELYKFRGYYLTIVKDKLRLDEEPLVFGATMETKDSIKALKKSMEWFKENTYYVEGEGNYPQIDFFHRQEERSLLKPGSRVENNPMETYGGYMTPLLARTNQNNRDFMNRMLEKPEIANRYLLHVTMGPLEGCVFDAEEPFLFLGDTPNKVIPNIHKKIYLKMVTIRDDVSRMQGPLRDEHRMTIATGLQKEQPSRSSVLPTEVMYRITEFGGKRKRKSNRMTRKRGGKKVFMDQIELQITWRGRDRSVYTVDERRFPHISSQDIILGSQSQSQSTEGSTNKVLLNEFNNDKESFDQLGKLKDEKRYIFVIVHEKEEGGQGRAVMYLDDAGNGDINHHNLSEDDDGRNNILAAGELIWDKGEKKLKISNQSGHYEPEAQDVKDVTIDFFAKSIDIDFYYPYNNDGSETPLSSQSQSPIEMGMRADEIYKAENEYYKEKKGGRRKSLKKRKSKRRKSIKKKQRKTKRKGRK